MELWIRSQDKTRLIKINSLEYVEYQGVHSINGYYTNESDNYDLGVYSTKERALEVLDEIQNILMPTIKYAPIIKEDIKPEYTYKQYVSEGANIEVIQLNTFVYQMPEN